MEQVLRLLVVATIVFALSLYARRVRSKPNRDKHDPHRVRVPKIVQFVGWFFLAMGAFMGLAVLAAPSSTEMPLGAKITVLGVVLGGVFFLLVYHRWYIEIGPDSITTRRVFSGTVTTKYQDIVQHRITNANQQQHLTITALDGTKQTVNISQYNASPLLNWLEFKDAVGRDPRPPELEYLAATGQWPTQAVQEAQNHATVHNQFSGQTGINEQSREYQTPSSPATPGTHQSGTDSSYSRPEPFITDMSSLYGKKRKKRN